MSVELDVLAILQAIGALLVGGLIVCVFAFIENALMARLFGRLTEGMPFGWTKPALVLPDGRRALFMPRPPKWTVVIPVFLICLILYAFLAADNSLTPKERTLNILALAGLGAWACYILLTSNVKLIFEGSTLTAVRPLGRHRIYDLTQLERIDPLNTSFTKGYTLQFRTGASVTAPRVYGGVLDLAEHLTAFHPTAEKIVDQARSYLQRTP